MIQIPTKLQGLPVEKNLPYIAVDRSFILIAHTGSGKTLLIPPYIHLKTGRKIILRQPTRAAAREVYNALNKFWGDRIDIGIHTSDQTSGTLDSVDIMVCTDGVMRNWLKNIDEEVTVVFDEYHSQMPITEIEAGIVKTYLNQGVPFEIVLLSATLRPSNIMEYFETLSPSQVDKSEISRLCNVMEQFGEDVNKATQNQWLKLYYSEGQPFDINDNLAMWHGKEESAARPGPLLNWCRRIKSNNKRAIAFLTTRYEVQKFATEAKKFVNGLETDFVHADRNISEIVKKVWDAEKNDVPFVLFSTSVFATSVTLPFDEVFVLDKGIDTIYEYGFEKTVLDLPLSNNLILQQRGRCGRMKKGTFTLASYHRTSLRDLKPAALEPPLEKCSPDQFVMTCAQYGLDPLKLDVMSNIANRELRRSVGRMKYWGLVSEDTKKNDFLKLVYPVEEEDLAPGELSLTPVGKGVNALPLDIPQSVMVRRCPKNIRPIIIASVAIPSLFRLFQYEVEPAPGLKMEGFKLIDPDLTHPTCSALTKAKILQGAMLARASVSDSLPDFANTNGMWANSLTKAGNQFYQICKSLNISERRARMQLMDMDIDALCDDVVMYLSSLKILEKNRLYWTDRGDRGVSYSGKYQIWPCNLDGTEQHFFGLDDSQSVLALGIPSHKTKNDFTWVIWTDTIILEKD